MRLPGSVKTAVRGLAKMPSKAPVALAKGQAVESSVRNITTTLDRMDRERTAEETRQLNLSMMQEQAGFDLTYNKDAYSAEEIPQGIDVRLTDTVLVDGAEQSVARADIPAYEVKAQIYKQEMDKALIAGAERITNKVDRARWLEDKQALVDVNTSKLLGQAEKDQKAYNTKKLALDINNAVDSKQYDIALALTADIKNPDAKVKARKQIKTTQELTSYDELILTKDDPDSWVQMEEDITSLRDPDSKSTLNDEQRNSEANKLENALSLGKQDYAIAAKSEIANAAADVKVD